MLLGSSTKLRRGSLLAVRSRAAVRPSGPGPTHAHEAARAGTSCQLAPIQGASTNTASDTTSATCVRLLALLALAAYVAAGVTAVEALVSG